MWLFSPKVTQLQNGRAESGPCLLTLTPPFIQVHNNVRGLDSGIQVSDCSLSTTTPIKTCFQKGFVSVIHTLV